MSSFSQPLSRDPADLFAQLYDALGDEAFRSDEAQGWLSSESVNEIAAMVEERLILGGALDPEEVEESIEFAFETEERIFAHLLGLDRALSYVNPHTATYDPAALLHLATRYAQTGRFDTGAVPGAVLPRVAFPGREVVEMEGRADAFASVVRVPPEEWERTDHSVIPNNVDFSRRERERGVAIACVPFIADPDELSWEIEYRNNLRRFKVRPIARAETGDRIERIVRSLDDLGASIAVLPELCLSNETLEMWQQALDEISPLPGSVLRWVFVGTGPIGSSDLPPNRGVLLDRDGSILLEQDKLYAFTMSSEQLHDWHLTEKLGDEQAVELMSRGERVTVAECGLGRLLILICEDLARVTELGSPLVAHGASLALAPVFSKPTLAHHWEHSHAKIYAQAAGTQVVVSNSLVVARLMGEDETGTSLAHSPEGHEVGRSESEDAVSMFHLAAGRHPQVLGRLRFRPSEIETDEPSRFRPTSEG